MVLQVLVWSHHNWSRTTILSRAVITCMLRRPGFPVARSQTSKKERAILVTLRIEWAGLGVQFLCGQLYSRASRRRVKELDIAIAPRKPSRHCWTAITFRGFDKQASTCTRRLESSHRERVFSHGSVVWGCRHAYPGMKSVLGAYCVEALCGG